MIKFKFYGKRKSYDKEFKLKVVEISDRPPIGPPADYELKVVVYLNSIFFYTNGNFGGSIDNVRKTK
jgi:hypothetical protein